MLHLIYLVAFLTSGFLGAASENVSHSSEPAGDQSSQVNVNIGFLVASERSVNQLHRSALPGKYLRHVFEYGINKMNLHSTSNKSQKDALTVKFTPITSETFGEESESIKQTINLITKRNVNFIVGPQDTCQVEARLASVFNVPMVSHYCPFPAESSNWGPRGGRDLNPASFIQMKPPHSSIVVGVVALLERLLTTTNSTWYPQQLVLLYLEQPAGVQTASNLTATTTNDVDGRRVSASKTVGEQEEAASYVGTDAIQYRNIGRLLEIELEELLGRLHNMDNKASSSPRQQRPTSTGRPPKRRSLAVLNWHTTFHYGIIKNPFLQIIKRHLLSSGQAAPNQPVCPLANNARLESSIGRSASSSSSAAASVRAEATTSGNLKPSIYVIVGHYYEHLGLMLALNELNQLAGGQPQSSVPGRNSLQKSIVVGVDIEQFDERDDSVRFLRGLLSDENPFQSIGPEVAGPARAKGINPINSVAAMYASYLGVVPSRATKTEQFLEELRAFSQKSTKTHPPTLQHRATSGLGEAPIGASANQSSTLNFDRIFSSPLFLFVRPPVEAFYLQEALQLVGSYFRECLIDQSRLLAECSQGQRAFNWFANRQYSSAINQQTVRLDASARAQGAYSIITIRYPESNQDAAEVGLEPVGSINNQLIESSVGPAEVDAIWLPLWCSLNATGGGGNESFKCNQFNGPREPNPEEAERASGQPLLDSLVLGLILTLILIPGLVLLIRAKYGRFVCDSSAKQAPARANQAAGCNVGWFNERDAKNFLLIVHNFLSPPETIQVDFGEPTSDKNQLQTEQPGGGPQRITEQTLECHMFPFQSCKFVHWIAALHQLKESMFRYQQAEAPEGELRALSCGSIFRDLIWRKVFYPEKRGASADSIGSFFTVKHKTTGSLRILLHKYKATNECFVELSRLNHCNIVKLLALKLGQELGSFKPQKVAQLVFEKPYRGNLRQVYRKLIENLEPLSNSAEGAKKARELRVMLVLSFIDDLLNGLAYLHQSSGGLINYHGELRSTTCMICENFQLKLAGFHAHHMRRSLGSYELKGATLDTISDQFIYSAPELLENCLKITGHQPAGENGALMKLADVYSFSFVLYELLHDGREPWSCLTPPTTTTRSAPSSRLLLERVRVDSSFRPPLGRLDKKSTCSQISSSHQNNNNGTSPSWRDNEPLSSRIDLEAAQQVLRSCWSQSPTRRPQGVESLRLRLDNAIRIKLCPLREKRFVHEIYTNLMERLVSEMGRDLAVERAQNELLRHKSIPHTLRHHLQQPIASNPIVETYNCVNFCFFRILLLPADNNNNFILSPLNQLNEILNKLDALVALYQNHLQVVFSKPDSCLRQMVYSGGPLHEPTSLLPMSCPQLLASFALQLVDLSNQLQTDYKGCLQLRCALHSGPAQAGLLAIGQSISARFVLLGKSMLVCDVLETSSLPQRIQISAEFRKQLLEGPHTPTFIQTPRQQSYVIIKREAKINAKNLGDLDAYWLLNGPRLSASQSVTLSRRCSIGGERELADFYQQPSARVEGSARDN